MPTKVSSGIITSIAASRGMTRAWNGLTPITCMASTSWFIRIEPISAANEDAERPGQQDGGDQHRQFAQHRHGDQLHGEHPGPELGQQIGAQEGDDGADEEVGHGDDRQGVEARTAPPG